MGTVIPRNIRIVGRSDIIHPAFAQTRQLEGKSLTERINSLPLWARDYIARIETEADPAGTQRLLIELVSLTVLRIVCS
jgi:hypothetical protein